MRAIAILIAGALGACTCGTLDRDELEARHPYAAGTLYSRGGLEPMLRELEKRSGGPLVATAISINPGSAMFTLRDPTRPGNRDNWSYDHGSFGDPQPVVTSRRDLEDDDSFAVAEVTGLSKLRELIDRALRESKVQGARVDGVSVTRASKRIEIRIGIKGPRERGQVTFDGKGELVETRID